MRGRLRKVAFAGASAIVRRQENGEAAHGIFDEPAGRRDCLFGGRGDDAGDRPIQRRRGRMTTFRAILRVAAAAGAQGVDARGFFAGKTVSVLAPFDGAGSYPQIALALANLLPKHLPGRPAAVAQFMPGAGGMKMANYLYRLAPKDGASIGVLFDGTASAQLLYADQGVVDYRADEFIPLGTLTRGDQSVLIVRADSAIRTVEDARDREVVVGGAAAGAGNVVVPRGLNFVLGTKFRVLTGYPTMASILLAMEQREVDATVVNWTNLLQLKPDWIAQNKVRVLAQVGGVRHRDLPDVRLISELTDDARARQALALISANSMPGKGVVTAPGVPADRVAALRRALADVMRDPEFAAFLASQKIDPDPQPPEYWTEVTKRVLATDPEIVRLVKEKIDVR
jgi:tripartite-type tricarboxylate transporter receptor subunit TctC